MSSFCRASHTGNTHHEALRQHRDADHTAGGGGGPGAGKFQGAGGDGGEKSYRCEEIIRSVVCIVHSFHNCVVPFVCWCGGCVVRHAWVLGVLAG